MRRKRILAILPATIAATALLVATGHAVEIRVESAVVTPAAEVNLPARTVGQLVEVNVEDGTEVKKGTRIARVDWVEAELTEKKARGALEIAKAEASNRHRVEASAKAAEVSRAEWQRAVEAGEKYSKSVSQTELDRLRLASEQTELESREAKHDMEVAGLNVRLKEIELEMVRRALERHELVAPIDGIVVEVKRHVGEWVEPGMPVVRIISPAPLRVEGFLDARRLSQAKPGSTVRFVPAGEKDSEAHVGRLSFISPEANPVNRQVRVVATFANEERKLQPGLQGVLVITVDESSDGR